MCGDVADVEWESLAALVAVLLNDLLRVCVFDAVKDEVCDPVTVLVNVLEDVALSDMETVRERDGDSDSVEESLKLCVAVKDADGDGVLVSVPSDESECVIESVLDLE